MRHLTTLVPFVVIAATKNSSLGYSRILTQMTAEEQQVAKTALATALAEVTAFRVQEVVDHIKESHKAAHEAETYDQLVGALEALRIATPINAMDEVLYGKVADIVTAFVANNGSGLSEEDKEVEAAILFTHLLTTSSEKVRETVAEVVTELSFDLMLKTATLKMKNNAAKHDVAPKANVLEQPEVAAELEENKTGNDGTVTEPGVGGFEANKPGGL